ncbi:hypothetical protein LXA45_17895, partial [Erwinia amylovora]|uniref:hypothetical protein n=1 Tax=Erwinia amylovora TaxID=552 RepID=UPI0020BE7E55
IAGVKIWNWQQQQQKALSSTQKHLQLKAYKLNYMRLRERQDISTQLRPEERARGLPVHTEPAWFRDIHTAFLTGMLSHIGQKD